MKGHKTQWEKDDMTVTGMLFFLQNVFRSPRSQRIENGNRLVRT